MSKTPKRTDDDKYILVAWLGMTDIKAGKGELGDQLGPIGQAVVTDRYDGIWLLSDHPPGTNQAFTAWLNQHAQGAAIEVERAKLPSPTDYFAISQAAMALLEKLKAGSPRAKLTFHLSPGTPAMCAVWLLLGSTNYPARFIASSPEKGVETVALPFGISTDLPPLISAQHADLLDLAEALPERPREFDAILHRCAPMKRAIAQARAIAQHDLPVLLLGESGTGKELFARAIHADSPRSGKPFIPVNCGAIPSELVEREFFGAKKGAYTGASADHQGYLEEANGGTLFLDEIGELPLAAQVKLLRSLQDGTVVRVGDTRVHKLDIRIVAATNRDLLAAVNDGSFRGDLFHRLAIGVIHLPPLRERQGDIGLLVDDALDQLNQKSAGIAGWQEKKLSASARNLLIQHPWPGNVRELQNTLYRAAIWAGGATIGVEEVRSALFQVSPGGADTGILDRPLGHDFNLRKLLDDIEIHYLKRAMKQARGVKKTAAKLLGIGHYQNVTNALKKHGLEDLAR